MNCKLELLKKEIFITFSNNESSFKYKLPKNLTVEEHSHLQKFLNHEIQSVYIDVTYDSDDMNENNIRIDEYKIYLKNSDVCRCECFLNEDILKALKDYLEIVKVPQMDKGTL